MQDFRTSAGRPRDETPAREALRVLRPKVIHVEYMPQAPERLSCGRNDGERAGELACGSLCGLSEQTEFAEML